MRFKTVIFITIIMTSATTNAEESSLTASLDEAAWNGVSVPVGQQCQKFGGQGASPKLKIENIPTGANAIVMAYSDRSYHPMDNGGHGQFGYRVTTDTKEVTIPALMGHTFEMPENFYLIEAQRAPKWDIAGAYLPPCSGGKGNDYYVTIRAVKTEGGGIREVLATTELSLGRY